MYDFIDISQGRVEMHLGCGGIYNNCASERMLKIGQ